MAPTPDKWLVVGLGNPGDDYADDRHNIGFIVVDELASLARGAWKRTPRLRGELAQARLAGQAVVLLKPQTYMNLSGESAGPAASYYRIPPERVIAIHDDIDLELGRIKVKRGGGDGGHKGVRSLAQHLGGSDFVRVRLGVGRPAHGDVVSFVLGGFRAEERDVVGECVKRAVEAVELVITHGPQEAMNRLSRPAPRSAGARPGRPG